MQNAPNHRKTSDFFLLMRLYGDGAHLQFSQSDTLAPTFHICTVCPQARRLARRAMASSKANESWAEPEGVACRLYKSGLVKFGVNLGWPKNMERTTKRTLAKSAVEAVRTHKDFALLAAYAASVASAQLMDVAQPSNAGAGQRELRGLQGEMSAPQQEQRTSVQPDLFMHSQSSVCDYKSLNLGSRNGAVRDVSYATATQRLEEMGLQSEAWLHELRTIVTQMDIILDCIPSVQVDAVSALQDAMLAILVNAEGEDTARRAPACEPTELTRAAEWEGRGLLRRGPGGSVRWSADPRHAALASAHRAVTVLRAPRKSCAGGLMLTRFASCFGLS